MNKYFKSSKEESKKENKMSSKMYMNLEMSPNFSNINYLNSNSNLTKGDDIIMFSSNKQDDKALINNQISEENNSNMDSECVNNESFLKFLRFDLKRKIKWKDISWDDEEHDIYDPKFSSDENEDEGENYNCVNNQNYHNYDSNINIQNNSITNSNSLINAVDCEKDINISGSRDRNKMNVSQPLDNLINNEENNENENFSLQFSNTSNLNNLFDTNSNFIIKMPGDNLQSNNNNINSENIQRNNIYTKENNYLSQYKTVFFNSEFLFQDNNMTSQHNKSDNQHIDQLLLEKNINNKYNTANDNILMNNSDFNNQNIKFLSNFTSSHSNLNELTNSNNIHRLSNSMIHNDDKIFNTSKYIINKNNKSEYDINSLILSKNNFDSFENSIKVNKRQSNSNNFHNFDKNLLMSQKNIYKKFNIAQKLTRNDKEKGIFNKQNISNNFLIKSNIICNTKFRCSQTNSLQNSNKTNKNFSCIKMLNFCKKKSKDSELLYNSNQIEYGSNNFDNNDRSKSTAGNSNNNISNNNLSKVYYKSILIKNTSNSYVNTTVEVENICDKDKENKEYKKVREKSVNFNKDNLIKILENNNKSNNLYKKIRELNSQTNKNFIRKKFVFENKQKINDNSIKYKPSNNIDKSNEIVSPKNEFNNLSKDRVLNDLLNKSK